MNDLAEFRWRVATGGYCVGAEKRGARRFLVANDGGVREYDPLHEVPALFRRLADLPKSEDAIIGFANEFGNLVEPESFEHGVGVPVSAWLQFITELRHAVDLLEKIRRPGLETLTKRITWRTWEDGASAVFYDTHPDLEPGVQPTLGEHYRKHFAIATKGDQWFDLFEPGHVLLPARLALHLMVNDGITRWGKRRITFGLSYDRTTGQSVLRKMPTDLLGCMWLQLAETVAGGREQRQCEFCKQWFEVKDSRPDRRYCSDACRGRVIYQKKQTAKKLHAKGKSIKDIAKAIDSEPNTVKGWLKKGK